MQCAKEELPVHTFSTFFLAPLLCCMIERCKRSSVVLMPHCVLVHKPDAGKPQEGGQVAKDLGRGKERERGRGKRGGVKGVRWGKERGGRAIGEVGKGISQKGYCILFPLSSSMQVPKRWLAGQMSAL